MASSAWRPEDDALLTCLTDQALIERAWAVLAGESARPPHARAAGVLAELRRSVDGAVAVEQARRGELAPLLRALTQPSSASLTPALAHHVALLSAQLAVELERRPDEARRASAPRAWIRALAMWLWLGREREYLRAMGAAVVGTALPPAQTARAVEEAPTRLLDALGERAREGARALTEPARIALFTLARAGQAAALAECDEETKRRVEVRARRERESAIDVALARVDAILERAIVDDAPPDEVTSLLWDGVAVWKWSERDEIVERALIQRITPYLWERYRNKEWDRLRGLLRPMQEPVDHLARAIERDPTKLAYAAPCAQMLVFRGEVETAFDAQLAHAEHAVRLCPTHRNGRLILADLLIERATRVFDRTAPWATPKLLEQAAADVARAEELYPQLRRLPEAKKRLESFRWRLDRG